jgi:hypothetical protein
MNPCMMDYKASKRVVFSFCFDTVHKKYKTKYSTLVTGTTRARFKSQQDSLKKVADSFVAIRAHKSQ